MIGFARWPASSRLSFLHAASDRRFEVGPVDAVVSGTGGRRSQAVEACAYQKVNLPAYEHPPPEHPVFSTKRLYSEYEDSRVDSG